MHPYNLRKRKNKSDIEDEIKKQKNIKEILKEEPIEDFIVDDEETIESLISKEIKDDLKPKLEEIEKYINDQTPTLEKILTSKLCLKYKSKCLELYKKMLMYDKFSLEYFDLKEDIMFIFNNKEYEEQISEIKNKYNDDLKDKILNLNTDIKNKEIIYEKLIELKGLNCEDSKYKYIKCWLDWSMSLPYNNTKELLKKDESLIDFLNKIKKLLDEKIFGLKDVKIQILEILNNIISSKNNSHSNIAFEGIPGVGKTFLCKCLAEILDLPFEQISLGGLQDSTIFHGSDSVWTGSTPGIIVKILKSFKYNNGIIFFDEIDKLGNTPRGKEVQYAMLHITDFTQNKEFVDSFLPELKIDLSKIWFVFAMNDSRKLDHALRDRLNIINIEPYNNDEKKIIINKLVSKINMINSMENINKSFIIDLNFVLKYNKKKDIKLTYFI